MGTLKAQEVISGTVSLAEGPAKDVTLQDIHDDLQLLIKYILEIRDLLIGMD
jgi:hypothetical protein